MNQQSTSDLPPLPKATIEEQYSEEISDKDQTVNIQSFMKQIQDLLLTPSKKKGKGKQSKTFTPGGSLIQSTLPRHVRPEESPISPTPVPRKTSTPVKEKI
ncbi:hypothetical protein O181_072548 [Austropuccinia psidii MF-1]|uniref:Uncharacterized protein n=1 Tax=Austropuccinia psidii MF-1 TaxID=1389203 RepID=A0A9Q3F376_9BASI|nr:hypothetical protein [Austropuccinia psidii MF-1]